MASIAAVPVRILREVLRVIVHAEAGNPTETPRLLPPVARAGRFSVDLDGSSEVEHERVPSLNHR